MIREAVRDRSYELTPLGGDVALYLRHKRKRLTDSSYESYESPLSRLALYFPDLQLRDFEPPMGTERLEEWLEHFWGRSERRTYNRNLTVASDFFKHWVRRGAMHGDPTLLIERAKPGQVHREVFTVDEIRAIFAAAESRRDRVALPLLLDYGLRKGALQRVQFKHFDYTRRRLTIFTKGQQVRTMPLPDPALWTDLERHVLEAQAEPGHYLMHRVMGRWRTPQPEKPMGRHGLHEWWYERLEDAGIVEEGERSGERMHKARHTAGQRIFDATGNLPATQALLGHKSSQTTADVYLRIDEAALVAALKKVLG
jgi:integrase